jgi:dihydrodipicolinate synthase/N-acetylneuraminate lyase
MRSLPRALTAIVTPFDDDLVVDHGAHRHNVSLLYSQGCTGLVLAGSTGEGPYLDPGERGSLVRETRMAAPGATIVCGINGESVGQASAQIAEAADSDADAALVATPTTLIRGVDSLMEGFYREVATASPIPVLLYSNPSVTAYEIPTQSVSALSEHSNIIGLKDSGGNPNRLDDLSDAIARGFMVFSGSSKTLLESAERGAYGAVTASANYAFDLVQGAITGSETAQSKLTSLTSVIEAQGRAGTKYAAGISGLQVGHPRPPLMPIDPHARAEIDAVLDSRKHAKPE